MANSFGFFNSIGALNSRFWKRMPQGSPVYPGSGIKPPFDYSIDNGWTDFALDPNGNPQEYSTPSDGIGRTKLGNPWGAFARAFQTNQLAAPTFSASNVTNGGTAGSTGYTYAIAAIVGAGGAYGVTPLSSTGATSTGNATLSGTNFNSIAFTPKTEALAYLIYRTVSSGTPSTTGIIGVVFVTRNADGSAAPITFLDTGIAGDGTTATTTNSTGLVQGAVYGDIATLVLSTPANVAATVNGTVGSTTVTYKVTALSNAGHTAASSAATTTTANATLSTTNSITITWNAVPGAVSYNVYRTAAGGTPSTTGLIGNVQNVLMGANGQFSFTDTGLAGDSSSAPTTNNTGGAVVNFVISGQTLSTLGNYIATESGAANAIVASLAGVSQVTGAAVIVKLGHTLQAGANTFNFNGNGAVAIKSSRNPANNIATAYAATGSIQLLYDSTGPYWLDLSQ